jgi:transposase-like protein
MEETKRVPRRPHSEELKTRVLAECMQQGASVAKVAMSHGLNANLVHKCCQAVRAGVKCSKSVTHLAVACHR